tara:strand:- start:15073 stop:17610 length:2538 start_codon:yes stop_codon:yes gene_type:complete
MALVKTDVPNLVGGVSQQPASMRLINQCEAQENAVSSPVEGLVKRPPTEHIKELLSSPASDLFIHHVNRDVNEQYFVICSGVNDASAIKVFDIAGAEKTVTHDTEGSAPETGYSYLQTSTPSQSLRAVTIADVTFFVNTEKTAALSSTLSTYSRNLAYRPHEALVIVKKSPGNFSKCELNIEINGVNTNLYVAGGGTERDFGYGADVENGVDALTTVTRIHDTLNNYSITNQDTDGSGSINTLDHRHFTTTHSANVVHVVARDGNNDYANGSFNITTSDGQANTILKVLKDEVENFSDLPDVAPDGIVFKVIGNPETQVDDYYVQFVVDENLATFGKGRWVETTDGGIKNAYDYDTMPHVLVRQADGSFKFTRGDGQFDGSVTGFSNFKFSSRAVGDLLTNPPPTFIDNKISDISFFKNRLVFLSGENVILSETGEYFNFFRTTLAQLVDADPVDVAVGGTAVSNLKHAVPFSNRLILFSETSQFSLQGEDTITPLNASITPQTEFEITSTTKPIVSGSNLFFAFPRGSFNGVKQFFKVNEVDIQFDAVEVTAQVPKYVKGDIVKFAATTHENSLLVLTDDDNNNLYVYTYFMSSGERLVSSWSKFTFNAQIYSIVYIDTTLFLLIKRGTKLCLEKIRMETGLTDTDSLYKTTLDRRVYKETGTYSSATNETTWTGFEYTPSLVSQVVNNVGQQLTVKSRSAGSVSVDGDFSSTPVYIGEPYTMRIELSEPIFKQRGTFSNQTLTPSTAGNRHQIRYMTVIFSDTAFFNVKVTPEYRDPFTYDFTGRQIGDSSSLIGSVPSVNGDFRVPVFAQSDRVKIELINSSPLPSNLQAVQYEGELTTRRR